MWKEQAKGRYHVQLLHSEVEAALIKQFEGVLWPLAAAAVGRDPLIDSPEQMQLTEVQLVASHTACAEQVWHVDNSLGGVTLILPLHDTPVELGPTQFLAGTHTAFPAGENQPEDGKTPPWWRSVYALSQSAQLGNPPLLVQPALQVGDLLVMDARTIHRGARNHSTTGQARFALIVRYDEWGSHPQTAQNPLRVLGVSQLGKWLHGIASASNTAHPPSTATDR
jgi:ectoine hydroxylase-related dioxygenase (phytanoyl-CoA dioxygenase family)